MFQISIQDKLIGKPMSYQEGVVWQKLLATTFPWETVWLKRVVAQYIDDTDAFVIFPLRKSPTEEMLA